MTLQRKKYLTVLRVNLNRKTEKRSKLDIQPNGIQVFLMEEKSEVPQWENKGNGYISSDTFSPTVILLWDPISHALSVVGIPCPLTKRR